MKDLYLVAAGLQAFLIGQGWKFCFIGGIALQRWGEPRLTIYVDVTLLTGFGGEEQYINTLLGRFRARRPDAARFALERRVLLMEWEGTGIDIALGALPFEERVIRRASDFQFIDGARITTCSAEDLIVMKAFADRGRDWEDIRGILIRQGTSVKWRQIFDELTPLCEFKEAAHILPRLEQLKQDCA
jgi:hypothetical protein